MLGEFGTERPQVDESFGYFGTTIRVNPDISDLAVIEMFNQVGDMSESEAAGTTRRIASALVHPQDLDEFLTVAIKNRQTLEDLIDVGLKIIEALTVRPTQLPSDSSAGQQRTVASSTGASSSRALQLLEGRPDLQVAVQRAQEARQAG